MLFTIIFYYSISSQFSSCGYALTYFFCILSTVLKYFFRNAGASKDYIVIGSDSGKMVIIEFDPAVKNWKVVYSDVFGRAGCRREIPGQYLAADPKGRALMIGKYLFVIELPSYFELKSCHL